VEAHNFEIRKHRLQYDDVMNHQRTVIYEQRKRVLLGEDLRESVLAQMRDLVEARTKEFASPEVHRDDWNLTALHQALSEVFPITITLEEMREIAHQEDLVKLLQEDIISAYEERERLAGPEAIRELEHQVTLHVVNTRWIDHLAAMEDLEEGIGLRGYSGTDPLILYRTESYNYWLNLLATIRDDIIRYLFRIAIEPQEIERQRRAALGSSNMPQGQPVEAEDDEGMALPSEPSAPASRPRPARAPRRAAPGRKVGRNDPCPCGSGKKYKKCCGRAAA